MFYYVVILKLLLLIHSYLCKQNCIDSCQFEYNQQSAFILPTKCNTTKAEQCSVMIVFDYNAQKINFDFNFESDKNYLQSNYQTDNIIRTVINLEEPAFIQHTIQYYCSTGDNCDLNYVKNIAIPYYTAKSCEKFRSKLIEYLNPSDAPLRRSCHQNNGDAIECDLPCDLIYDNPKNISRSCDGQIDLTLETSIGQSTPINKPEYDYRKYSYACKTSLCNGRTVESQVRNLIEMDNGECMSFINQTTTSLATSIAKTNHSHVITFSMLFVSIIFIVFFIL